MSDGYWAQAAEDRRQRSFFSPSLDESLPADHVVRRVDAVLAELDWSAWEDAYDGRRGRPPIHPRRMAAVILYGLMIGARSSRDLEEATWMRLDMMWLTDGTRIDHSTLAGFRVQFREALRALVTDLARVVAGSKLGQRVGVDGTRVRASNGRHRTSTAEALEARERALCEAYSEALEAMARQDAVDDPEGVGTEEVTRQLRQLEQQRKRLKSALSEAKKRDSRRRHKRGRNVPPGQVPDTDPQAHVIPGKNGEMAPHYEPTVGVDLDHGVIISADVPEGSGEAKSVGLTITQMKTLVGRVPQVMVMDARIGSTENLELMASHGIAAYAPVRQSKKDPEGLGTEAARRWRSAQGHRLRRGRCGHVERVFGHIKQNQGLRQFSCRGRAKVQAEWRWASAAYNLIQAVKHLKHNPLYPTHAQNTFSRFIDDLLDRIYRHKLAPKPTRCWIPA